MNFKIFQYFRDYKKIIIVICLIGISITLTPSADGYLLSKTNLDLYLEHDLIVMGQVISLKNVEDESTTPRTAYEITILQYIMGNTETNEITVIGLGQINSTRQIDKQTILVEGQKILLMLHEQTKGDLIISPYSVSLESLNPDSQFVLPPLKLYKAGIPSEEIHCKSNLKFVLKASNQYPVCLKPQSIDRLLDRGWVK